MTEISELVEFGKLTKQNACKVPGVATFYFLQYLSRLPVPAPSCLWPAAFLSKAAISFLCALKIIFLRVTVLPSFLVDSEVTIHVGFFCLSMLALSGSVSSVFILFGGHRCRTLGGGDTYDSGSVSVTPTSGTAVSSLLLIYY